MKPVKVFKIGDLISGGVKKDTPIKVDTEKLVTAFKAIGIDATEYAYVEYGSLQIEIKIEGKTATIIFH